MTLTTNGSQPTGLATSAPLYIRPWTGSDADYAVAVAIGNAAYPEYPDTVQDWKFEEHNRADYLKHARWLAELDGEPVAFGSYEQLEDMYHPRRFWLSIAVPPNLRGRGIGAALYREIVDALAKYDPLSLRSRCREDEARSLRFLRERGFVEDMREWESRIDPSAFDPAPYAEHAEAVRASGIAIVTLAELMARDPEHRHKLWELDTTLSNDVPSPEPHTPRSEQAFCTLVFDNPNLLPDGYFVAVDGTQYVGSSALWKSQADANELYTGLTGVRREQRRRGIALALKLRGIAYAKEHGVRVLKTWNEANNRAMLNINEMLGFIKQPAWVTFVQTIKEEEPV